MRCATFVLFISFTIVLASRLYCKNEIKYVGDSPVKITPVHVDCAKGEDACLWKLTDEEKGGVEKIAYGCYRKKWCQKINYWYIEGQPGMGLIRLKYCCDTKSYC